MKRKLEVFPHSIPNQATEVLNSLEPPNDLWDLTWGVSGESSVRGAQQEQQDFYLLSPLLIFILRHFLSWSSYTNSLLPLCVLFFFPKKKRYSGERAMNQVPKRKISWFSSSSCCPAESIHSSLCVPKKLLSILLKKKTRGGKPGCMFRESEE